MERGCAFRTNRIAHPASNSASTPKPQVESVGTVGTGGTTAVTFHVVWLLAVFGAGVVETTVAVLAIGPGEFGL